MAPDILLGVLFMGSSRKGWKARLGYADSRRVISALEKYHAANGNYPADLDELVPRFVKQPLQRQYGYRNEGDSFTLSFTYTGPGINRCSYESKTKTWRASGHY